MPYRDSKAALRALTATAAMQGGYFTAQQAEKAGYDYPHLSYHISAGNFERVGRGLYRIPSLPYAEHDDLIRLWLWSRGRDDRPQAIVSHHTALALHDLAEFIPTEIHLTVPPRFRKQPPEGCTLHKATVESTDTQPFDALPVTTPHRTLRDLAANPSMPTEQFEKAVAEAVARGLIRRSQSSDLIAARREAMQASDAEGRQR